MIKKVVIPAAGLGTRFLPATKAQPKEMLPIVDKPTIQYIVEEAIGSGVESILIITGRNKRAIEDHFDRSLELEIELEKSGKQEMLKLVREIGGMVNLHFIRQKTPRGLGDAILCAKDFVGNEPFGVLLGDDIVVSKKPALKQLFEIYEKYGRTVVGIQEVPHSDVSKYGIIAPSEIIDGTIKVASMVHRPIWQLWEDMCSPPLYLTHWKSSRRAKMVKSSLQMPLNSWQNLKVFMRLISKERDMTSEIKWVI